MSSVLILRYGRLVTAFERQAKEGFKTGENQMMISNIKDMADPDKKKVN